MPETPPHLLPLPSPALAPAPHSILVNCAGRFLDETFHLTVEGLEQTLALGYFAHVLLTLKLLDTLSRNGPSRVINVSR